MEFNCSPVSPSLVRILLTACLRVVCVDHLLLIHKHICAYTSCVGVLGSLFNRYRLTLYTLYYALLIQEYFISNFLLFLA